MTCHRALSWSRRTLCSKSCRINAICSSSFVFLLRRFRFLFCEIVRMTKSRKKMKNANRFCCTLCSKSCWIAAICSSNFVFLLKRFRFLFCVIVDEITMRNRKQNLTSYYCQFHDLKKMKYVKFSRLNDIKTIIKFSFIEYFVSVWINWRNRFQK